MDLEKTKEFYTKYFGGSAGEMYFNPRKRFSSYMLSFKEGAKLEIMSLPDIVEQNLKNGRTGFVHISFSVGSREEVDRYASMLSEEGFPILDGPRVTGDGFYECQTCDPEGNVIEITI